MDPHTYIQYFINTVFICQQKEAQTNESQQNGHAYDIHVYSHDIAYSDCKLFL